MTEKSEFWTLFNYGGNPTICSKHKSRLAAVREALKCERAGGAIHWIVKVTRVPYLPLHSR